MIRLALGAKCGLPSGSKDVSASPANEERRLGFSKEPSAAAPMPAAVRLKKWRRVRRRLFSLNGFICQSSSFGQCFIQVQNYARDRRPGCQFRRIEIGLGFEGADLQQFF